MSKRKKPMSGHADSASASKHALEKSAKMHKSNPIVQHTNISKQQSLVFHGSKLFRMRLVCSLLSGKPIRITKIRELDEDPGVRDYEVSFLKLLDTLTNGTVVKINDTGTTVSFKPGMLIGGEFVHDCPVSRAVGYFIEPLFLLTPFSKNRCDINFKGVTNDNMDISVDILRTVTIPLIKRFMPDAEIKFKVNRRGARPLGGGDVYFAMAPVRELTPVNMTKEGKFKRVRGVAFTMKCSNQIAMGIIDKAREVLNNLLPDVYIYTDHSRGKESGLSPGFGVSMAVQSTEGVMLSAEVSSEGKSASETGNTAAMGQRVAFALLDEVKKGGTVDTTHQSIALMLMMLCPEDISKVRLGKLSKYSISCLRLFREVFGVVFHMRADHKASDKHEEVEPTILVSVRGIGYRNLARVAA